MLNLNTFSLFFSYIRFGQNFLKYFRIIILSERQFIFNLLSLERGKQSIYLTSGFICPLQILPSFALFADWSKRKIKIIDPLYAQTR